MKVAFAILTWGNKEERKENFKFSLNKLKNLIDFLEKNNIQCSLHPYCFGDEKLSYESTHVNLTACNYYRSFKINYVIKNIINDKIEPDIFCCLDSDIFILEQDFSKFLDYIKNTNFKNTFLTARWYDSSHREDFNFDNYTYSDHIRVETLRSSDASGFFLVDFKTLKFIGGYDERFTVWGGEDNDISTRLQRIGIAQEYMNFFFIHIKHERLNEITILETEYKDLYLNQVKIAQTDKSIVRPTLINDYYVQDKI
jgi:predicted glycosyltransferase involved in capsule biosynthesis